MRGATTLAMSPDSQRPSRIFVELETVGASLAAQRLVGD
jgi:hypothetical protein